MRALREDGIDVYDYAYETTKVFDGMLPDEVLWEIYLTLANGMRFPPKLLQNLRDIRHGCLFPCATHTLDHCSCPQPTPTCKKHVMWCCRGKLFNIRWGHDYCLMTVTRTCPVRPHTWGSDCLVCTEVMED